MNKTKYWVWLQLVFGVYNNKVFNLIDVYSCPKELYENILKLSDILSKKDIEKIKNTPLDQAEEIINKTIQDGYDIITIDDEDYPYKLKNIYCPPIVLYCTKNFRDICNKFSIAVVGSRKVSSYGVEVTAIITEQLTKENVVIVSGLAYGVDKIAHETTVKNDGETIAVLGCGLDKTYPSVHKVLRKSIEIKGAIVTEFILGTVPFSSNFPTRNRIIAGLCEGILVTEAGSRSGTLVTAKFAFEENRDVFCVPSNIFAKQTQGTNFLLKSYGKLTTGSEDIFLEYKHIFEEKQKDDRINKKDDNSISKNLTMVQQKVIDTLNFNPIYIDEISSKTGLDIITLNEIIFTLELDGLVSSHPGKRYTIKY
ncbi:MAG: DNA-processing protein DprA [Oscillospiraceae bacterium]